MSRLTLPELVEAKRWCEQDGAALPEAAAMLAAVQEELQDRFPHYQAGSDPAAEWAAIRAREREERETRGFAAAVAHDEPRALMNEEPSSSWLRAQEKLRRRRA